MLPYVVIACYVRTDGWLIIRLRKITGDFFSSNIGSQCRFVIKRGHIFTIPFRVKFIHLIPLPKCKNLGFIKIEGVITAMNSEYPFKYLLVLLVSASDPHFSGMSL